jgi:transposase-like protein
MLQEDHKCSRIVDGSMECMLCAGKCVKNGKTKELTQRYKCKQCGKTFMEKYYASVGVYKKLPIRRLWYSRAAIVGMQHWLSSQACQQLV